MNYEVTQNILSHAEEFLARAENSYWKYKGLYWQLSFLGQFLADGRHPKILQGVEIVLSDRKWVSGAGGHCLTANILRALTDLGFGDHPRVLQERETLAKRVVAEKGIDCTAVEYSPLPKCYMAQPKLLFCFTQIPPEDRSEAVCAAIQILAARVVENEVFVYVPARRKEWFEIIEKRPKKADLPKGETIQGWVGKEREAFIAEYGDEPGTPKKGWSKFGFPLHYNSDTLEALFALSRAGIPMSDKLKRAVETVRNKRTADGIWCLENSLNGKMWVDVETKGKPSKWVTYFALRVLDHYGA
jgi:hypothetical protein